MIITLISWGWIGLTSFVTGFAIFRIIRGWKQAVYENFAVYLLFGLCALTVYSQFFSLFGKIGALANFLLAILCAAAGISCRRQIHDYIKQLMSFRKYLYVWIIVFIIGLTILAFSSGTVYHYDTDLYHAQAIRWIEEYGSVKGLGNLHNRLAYDSSFFCLQALYSLKFMTGHSLHTLNGFITTVILSYCVTSLGIFRKCRAAVSDLLKIAALIYILSDSNLFYISSPGSDLLTLFMVLYILARWAELMEAGCREPLEYGLLCILAVWTITLKLSAAALILLTIYPAVLLVRKKRWKQIAVFLAVGVMIMVTYLARNVILSGYLVYPYASVDLFDVDWKMSSSVAEDDSMEIMAWGRGMMDRTDYDAPLAKWLPVWYDNLTGSGRLLVWINVLCLVITILYAIWSIWRGISYSRRHDIRNVCEREQANSAYCEQANFAFWEQANPAYCEQANFAFWEQANPAYYEQANLAHSEQWCRLVMLLASTVGLLMWFFTAPLMRYGIVYMLLLPAILCGFLAGWLPERMENRILAGAAVCLIAVIGYPALSTYFNLTGLPAVKWPADYNWKTCEAISFEDMVIYVPIDGDCTGYHYFPGTNYAKRLEAIELRSGQPEDGFRLKEEYREKKMTSDGIVIE